MFAVLAIVGLAGDAFSREAVRLSLPAAATVPRLVDSIIPCMDAEIAVVAAEAADLRGEAGLRGDTGRENAFLMGECCLMGDWGKVRELCDRGERTFVGLPFREVALGGAAFVFCVRVFFAMGRESVTNTSSSLSRAMWICEDLRFLPFGGDCCGRTGEGAFEDWSGGSGGKGRSRAAAKFAWVRVGCAACDLEPAACLFMSSRIVIFRIAIGMRLTRLSSRDLRSAH